MMDRNEYKELIQELDCLTNELDINIISTMSIDGYVVINDYCSNWNKYNK